MIYTYKAVIDFKMDHQNDEDCYWWPFMIKWKLANGDECIVIGKGYGTEALPFDDYYYIDKIADFVPQDLKNQEEYKQGFYYMYNDGFGYNCDTEENSESPILPQEFDELSDEYKVAPSLRANA